jgi:hypothetical protein
MLMNASPGRRALALTLTLSTLWLLAAVPALPDDGARFSGRVFRSDGATPRPGVVVALVEPDSHRIYRSGPTNDEGAFAIDSAPAGTYTLLAEVEEGAYLAANSLELRDGDNRPLALALQEQPANANLAPGQSTAGGGFPTWAKWLIAGGIVVLGAVLISDATDEPETEVSPF